MIVFEFIHWIQPTFVENNPCGGHWDILGMKNIKPRKTEIILSHREPKL